jgi:hypothetical protein
LFYVREQLSLRDCSEQESRQESPLAASTQIVYGYSSASAVNKLTYLTYANKLQPQTNSNLVTVLSRQPPQKFFLCLRIVAGFVLASIAWGSTVELTHHHGVRAAKLFSASEAANASLAGEQAGERVFQADEPQRSSSRSKAGSECLICQLHHNLQATLISEPPGVGATETNSPSATCAVALQLSEFTANQHGRAPPLFSLS